MYTFYVRRVLFLPLQYDSSDPSFKKRKGIQNGESLNTPPSPTSVEKISKCLSPPPFYLRHSLFFLLLFFYPPHQEIYFSPMKLFRFPHKRSPMKIYMRSFRRWFIPKIRSIKRKILFILSSSFQQPIF